MNVISPIERIIVYAPAADGLMYVAIRVKISNDHHPHTPRETEAKLF